VLMVTMTATIYTGDVLLAATTIHTNLVIVAVHCAAPLPISLTVAGPSVVYLVTITVIRASVQPALTMTITITLKIFTMGPTRIVTVTTAPSVAT
jgi:hypothetical protein